MNIVMRNTDDIKPYEKNPRVNDRAIAAVARSIVEFGFQQPIVVDADDVIIVGHTRWRAAKKIGMKMVPVVVADKLTPAQVKAYRIADNQTNTLADWDDALLLGELNALKDDEFDLSALGFADDELLKRMAADNTQGPTEFAEVDENIPTEHSCPRCGYKWSGGE